MSDSRGDDGTPMEDEDRLPWLEAVDEDEERDGPSPMKLIAAVLIGLVAIGLVVSGLFWMSSRPNQSGPETIAADEGDYKARPENPGGMQVEGTGDASFAASEGAEPKGTINVDAVPEAPISKAPAAPAPAAKAPAPAPATKAPPAPKAAPAPAPVQAAAATAGGAIQLGAFSSQSAADGAWKNLSARFKYLQPLTHSVSQVKAGGRTLYRLRASGPNAANLCGRLRVAGETCVSVS